ncbi:hypothetical protein ACFV6E_30185 [Streptomyces sp. NPDC059785]|uniref:hypothetical protein n=1 Tax=Streptomyces sp. NPDC059785 TaxID=3346945 RepID=UPI00364F4450
MPSESATAANWSRYAGQAVSDLEENRRRQRELTRQMELLRQEESLLLSILTLADHPAAAQDSSHVPEQARGERGTDSGVPAPAAGTPSPAGDSTGKPRGTRAASAGKNTGGTGKNTKVASKKSGSRQQPLRELLLGLLRQHSEPRLAAELREELLRKHPDRGTTPQVVRNTLETLVAKGRVQRHKQQRSVLYTVLEARDSDTGSDTGSSSDGDTAKVTA